ncbi:MAG TPA: hypothetical protein VFW44_10110, partial [Bryobacteraceae bacterium]|nr:hypothetical protein [Bryobacteraceae bacterium]
RYSAYNFVSGVLGLIGAYLTIRYAPLPLYVRLLLPFTYYLCYQYAVIARSYALIAPLLFTIAALYPRSTRLPWLMTLLLDLLAAVSVHGFLLSACIWVTLYGPALVTPERKKLLAAGLTYWCILVILLVCAWPAKDVTFAAHRGLANLRLLPEVTAAGLAGAFAGQWIFSLILIALSIPFLWRGGGLLVFLISSAALCLFGSIVYAQLWHFGILFLVWIFAMWISAQKIRVTRPALVALLAAIAVQCYWTASTIRYDWGHAYSGSRATAEYLHRTGLPPGGLYAIGYSSDAVQPYFDRNIYSDYHGAAYWDWSARNTAGDPAALVASDRRELVLVGYKSNSERQQWADLLQLLGYSPAPHFEGATFWQTRVFEPESYDLYRRTSAPRLTGATPLAGFYASEGTTRWTAKDFSILLPAEPGEALVLHFFVPDIQIQHLGVISLTADVNGRALPAMTFPRSGEYTYSAPLSAAGTIVVNFHLDKASVGLNGDARELGVIVSEVGSSPPSLAR